MRTIPLAIAALVLSVAGADLVALGTASDGRPWRLAYATETRDRRGLDVYVALVPGGRPQRVAGVGGRNDFSPSWSPDGRLIVYRVNPRRGDQSDI